MSGPASSLPPPPAPRPPMPDVQDAPRPDGSAVEARRPRWPFVLAGLVVMVVIATIAVAAGLSADDRDVTVSMPETLAGHDRVTGPEIDELVDSMEEDFAGELPGKPVLGVYGTLSIPTFIVLAIDGPPPPGDPFEAMGSDLSGLGTSGSIDVDAMTTSTEGSVTYRCAPYEIDTIGGTVRADLCVWTEPSTFGVVWSFDPQTRASDITPEVHDAVVVTTEA